MNKIKLVQCYHCYAIADHKRPACPYLAEPQKCPRCSQIGHRSWQCENRTYCLHCSGPHPVTAPCCPLYQKKLNELKPDLLKELLDNTDRPQETPNQSNLDVRNLLMTSALMANGSLRTFIDSLYTASQALAQAGTPISSYHPYSHSLAYNQDLEFSFHSLSENNSMENPTYLEDFPVETSPNLLTPHSTFLASQTQVNSTSVSDPSKECAYFLSYEDHNFATPTSISSHDLEMTSQCPSTYDSSLESLLPPEEEFSTDVSASTHDLEASSKYLPSHSNPPEYTDGLRSVHDLENSNPDVFYLPIPMPNDSQLYGHYYDNSQAQESETKIRWYSNSQLYYHRKAKKAKVTTSSDEMRLNFIALPERAVSLEALILR